LPLVHFQPGRIQASSGAGGSNRFVIARFRTVNAILEQTRHCRLIRKSDLRCGTRLMVTTENSVYSIDVLEDEAYSVRGGWFDRQKVSPIQTSIAGCTWGGSVIKVDIVAACGLRLEFGNRVRTSRIREVHVIRGGIRGSQALRPADSRELFLNCYGPRWDTASAG
jgi:hypothetical protein